MKSATITTKTKGIMLRVKRRLKPFTQ